MSRKFVSEICVSLVCVAPIYEAQRFGTEGAGIRGAKLTSVARALIEQMGQSSGAPAPVLPVDTTAHLLVGALNEASMVIARAKKPSRASGGGAERPPAAREHRPARGAP